MRAARNCGANELSGRHKAHIDPCQEQHQAHIGIEKPRGNPEKLMPVEPSRCYLKQQEQNGYRDNCDRYLLHIDRQADRKLPRRIPRRHKLRYGRRRIGNILGPV